MIILAWCAWLNTAFKEVRTVGRACLCANHFSSLGSSSIGCQFLRSLSLDDDLDLLEGCSTVRCVCDIVSAPLGRIENISTEHFVAIEDFCELCVRVWVLVVDSHHRQVAEVVAEVVVEEVARVIERHTIVTFATMTLPIVNELSLSHFL